MKIYSVYDQEFKVYGKVHGGYDSSELLSVMKTIPMPESGVSYQASVKQMEQCRLHKELETRIFGGIPIETGLCWGFNHSLNCLEYHRCSEINIGAGTFILLVASLCEVEDGILDTSKVKAFRADPGVVVELYATTLHYAPCQVDADGFRVAVVLVKGTNEAMPEFTPEFEEDDWMTACNKWLLAHPESVEASQGAHIGLKGTNITV